MSGFNNIGKPVGDTTLNTTASQLPSQDIGVDDIEKLLNQEDGKDDKKSDTFSSKEEKVEEKKPAKSEHKKEDNETKDESEDEIELSSEEEEEETLEEDNEEEKEEELESKKKEDDDDLKIEAPPRKKEVLAKYPKFFEEFPFFEKMMFRDRWYSENFGSMDDAKGLLERVEQFDEIEQKLFTGDISHVLLAVKESDSKAYDKIVDNYINFLENNDKDAFNDVANTLVKRVIMGMVQKSKSKEDKDLYVAADILHEFFFDKPLKEFEAPKNRVVEEKTSESKKLEEERQSFMKERFDLARGELSTKIDNVLRSTIEKYIDPKESMTPYERKTAVSDTLKLLHKTLGNDKNFKNNLDKLWKVAFGSKFKPSDLENIKKSYLGRAKSELSDVIKKVRSEVLKGKEPKDRNKEDNTSSPKERKTTPGRPRETSNTDKTKFDASKQTVEDFLSSP